MRIRTPRAICFAFSLVAALSAGRAARALPPGAASLEANIRGILGRYGCNVEKIGIAVLSGDGSERASIHPHLPLKPASNMKILTTAAALRLLGAEYLYETRISASAPIRQGRIAGDIVVFGTGDPNISGRFYDDDPLALFRTWTRKLREAGLARVEGDLIVDDTFFDDVRFLPTWKRSTEDSWYSAEISPLSLNDNCLDITVRPGPPGQKARVEVIPRTDFVSIDGALDTSRSSRTKVVVRRTSGTNKIEISGRIHRRSAPWKGHVTVHDPAMFFGHVLAETFREGGIEVKGAVRRAPRTTSSAKPPAVPVPQVARADPSPPNAAAAAPPKRVPLVVHTSPLAIDLPVINKRSQNLHAEILLKTLGARAGGEGSVSGGASAIRRFLQMEGISPARVEVADGSGLSHANRVTAHVLSRVLHQARHRPTFEIFRASLAVAGVDGTLDDRFKRYPHLHGRVRAKTGYIDGVSTLSGYVARGETEWAFSVLLNSLPRRGGGHHDLLDEIVDEIHEAMGQR